MIIIASLKDIICTGVIRCLNKVYASEFVGKLTGNAATATKLATARTIALTGAVTGSGTFDGSGKDETKLTALSFLNNIRCLQRMKHELVRLGRSYLFEFNDSITLSKMSSVLNKYMNEWVSNRTLNYAYVNVQKNPNSDEAVDVTMDVRFTGTIEVSSVEITIR